MAVKVKTLADGTEILTEQATAGAPHMQVVRVGRSQTGTTGSASVTTTATLVVASNANRIEVVVCNDSANTVYVGLSSAITARNGIRLATGEKYYTNNYSGAVYAIVATGVSASVVTYAEIA